MTQESEQFQQELNQCTEKLQTLLKKTQTKIDELATKEKDQKEREKKIQALASKAKQKIKLNVGGKLFTTSRSTLLTHQESLFYTMLSSGNWEPDENGEYFIDRNPEFFEPILDYMRHGTMDFEIDSLDKNQIERFKRDVDFYQILGLCDMFVKACDVETENRVRFVGFAEWVQIASVQTDEEQDKLMDEVAAKTFPNSRAATSDEYMQKLIVDLPKKNKSGRYVILKMPGSRGDVCQSAKSGNFRRGISRNLALDGTFHHFRLQSGTRATICVVKY